MLLSERVVRPPAKFWDDSWRTTTAHSRNYAASKLHGKPIHHGETRSSYPILTRRSNRRRLDHHNNMGCLADYISQRVKWAGGVECRALNEVFVQVGSRIRINFISDEHQQIFGTELNSAQTNEKLLLLISGPFQLLRPLKATDTTPGSQKPTKRSHSEITAPNSNKRERKRTRGGTPKPPSVKRPGQQQQNKKTTQRKNQPEMTPKKASRKTPKKKKRLRKKYTWFT